MRQTQRQISLLDMLDNFLVEIKEPIHYKELTRVLIESGLWEEPYGKDHAQIIFNTMHNDIKKHGQGKGRFIFMGDGVFCTSDVEALEEVLECLPTIQDTPRERDPYYRSGDMPGDTQRRREAAEAAEASKCCYNCTHMYFRGCNLHTHEVGSCHMYSITKRSCVHKSSPACDLWKNRTQSQIIRDKQMPRELVLSAEHVRLNGSRSRQRRGR